MKSSRFLRTGTVRIFGWGIPERYRSMASAARLPPPMASTTVAGPTTASPAANTAGQGCFHADGICFDRISSGPRQGPQGIQNLSGPPAGRWMKLPHPPGIQNHSPQWARAAFGHFDLRVPARSSRSAKAVTFPFSPTISTGTVRKEKRTRSSSACSTSSSLAGISERDRR